MMGDKRRQGNAATQFALPLAQGEAGRASHHGRAANGPAGASAAVSPPGEQTEGRIEYDGARYRYHGFVFADGAFVPKRCAFTPDEAGVLPGCDPDRMRAMLDCVGRDAKRQEEIRRFGMLAWHSPYRPEAAAQQAPAAGDRYASGCPGHAPRQSQPPREPWVNGEARVGRPSSQGSARVFHTRRAEACL